MPSDKFLNYEIFYMPLEAEALIENWAEAAMLGYATRL